MSSNIIHRRIDTWIAQMETAFEFDVLPYSLRRASRSFFLVNDIVQSMGWLFLMVKSLGYCTL
jgi:hypothetical protein